MPSPLSATPFSQLTIPYPKNRVELAQWFGSEEGCLNYLDSLRWADGFVCPRCGGNEAWHLRAGQRRCKDCRYRASVTAGTIFNATRKPLTAWFEAIWHVCGQKNGGSALALQHAIGLGSYHTSWAWLHRMRRAMVVPGRSLLSGEIEVDETFIGGVKPGVRGRGAAGKSLVLIAAEIRGASIGRIRLQVIPNATAVTLLDAVAELAEPGSDIVTDGWSSYAGLPKRGFNHTVSRATPVLGSNLLPHVHRIASLLKRWLLGTHQGAVSHDLLQHYLDEFVFRFNRRYAGSRGLIFRRLIGQAIAHPPVVNRDLRASAATP